MNEQITSDTFENVLDKTLRTRHLKSASGKDQPTIVLLHEGLGGIERWKNFPDLLATLDQLDLITQGVGALAQTVVLEACGHSPHVQAKDQFLEALRLFVELPFVFYLSVLGYCFVVFEIAMYVFGGFEGVLGAGVQGREAFSKSFLFCGMIVD